MASYLPGTVARGAGAVARGDGIHGRGVEEESEGTQARGAGARSRGVADSSGTTLTVVIANTASPVVSLANFTQTVVVENTGDIEATNVEATITLDGAVTYVSCSGTGWTCNEAAGVVTCTRAALAVGVAPTLTLTTTAPGANDTLTTLADAIADNAPAATQDDVTTSVLHVPKDATSGWRCPLSQADWDNVSTLTGVLVSGAPPTVNLSAGCQDASGATLTATVGANGAIVGTVGYQQAEAGWDRDAIVISETAGERCGWPLGGGQNPATASSLWFFFGNPGTPASDRVFLAISQNVPSTNLSMTSGNKLKLVNGANNATSTGNHNGAVHCFALQTNRPAGTVKGFSELEKLTCTYTAPVDGVKGFGSSGTACPVNGLWIVNFSGASAELSEAEIKLIMNFLTGGEVVWSP